MSYLLDNDVYVDAAAVAANDVAVAGDDGVAGSRHH